MSAARTVRTYDVVTGPRVAGALRRAGIATRLVGDTKRGTIVAHLADHADIETAAQFLRDTFPGFEVTTKHEVVGPANYGWVYVADTATA